MDMEEEGFTDITGIDYCQEAIDLAVKVSLNMNNNFIKYYSKNKNNKLK